MKIAVVQMDVAFANKEANLAKILDRISAAGGTSAGIVIFPECALTGYCFNSLEEARPLAEPVPGPSTEVIARLTRRLGCTVIVGLLESSGEQVYNAAAVITPAGIEASFRKIHLPFLGVDRFVTPGDRPFAAFATPQGKLGVNICYDASFPEAARVLKLDGAQLLAIPTNWPVSSDSCQHLTNVRALENHMVVAAADRIGEERGFRFAGRSQIADFTGRLVAETGETDETIIDAEVDLAAADRNRVVRIPGVYEIDRIAGRRPEMYGAITQAPGWDKPTDGSLNGLVSEALSDFRKAAALASPRFSPDSIAVEIATKPHNPPKILPMGKMAVYAFFLNGQSLKVGKVGPNSGPRYTSQHYSPGSAGSTLAGSILKDPTKVGAVGVDSGSVGDWIKNNTDRVNLLLPVSSGLPILSLLESFLHVRWKPQFEGRLESG
ncbi:MAG: carbon-nitrogen hydrolase family protein [Terriglobia bacterium]